MKIPKSNLLALSISVILTNGLIAQEIPDGPYFGQKPPGLTPEVFAPGIVSVKDRFEYSISFSSDGKECCFGVTNSDWSSCDLYYTKHDQGRWMEPTKAYFQKGSDGWLPSFTINGEKFFFSSGHPNQIANIWMCHKTDAGWSDPAKLAGPVNTSSHEWAPISTMSGTLYFTSNRNRGEGEYDIYRSKLTDNQYVTVENLGTPVNSPSTDASPFISPDEEYLIFESWRPGGYGQGDLYKSYSKGDGSWTNPKNLGPTINTDHIEDGGYVSPDGKYFFFNRRKSWQTDIDSDIYWVDIRAIFPDTSEREE